MSTGLKPFNLVLAQLRVPFLPQQPQTQFPSASIGPSAVSTGTTNASTGSPFGRSCTGCITTQNLANGAVTNPKLGPLSVSSAKIGTGQVTTGNIADQAVATGKIAPSAVPTKMEIVYGNIVNVSSGTQVPGDAYATCPPSDQLVGGGFFISDPLVTSMRVIDSGKGASDPQNTWHVEAVNDGTQTGWITAQAFCAQPTP
jgi:hypothetical protein